MLASISGFLEALEERGIRVRVLFLDAGDECLIRRYKETRRVHPLMGETGTVESAIALDLNADGGLDLYTANELNLRKKGTAAVRKYNAQTGAEIWCTEIGVAKDKKGSAVIGFRASPVIGQNSLDELVYYTVTGLNDEGRETLNVADSQRALPM